jgi:hypothetical protein
MSWGIRGLWIATRLWIFRFCHSQTSALRPAAWTSSRLPPPLPYVDPISPKTTQNHPRLKESAEGRAMFTTARRQRRFRGESEQGTLPFVRLHVKQIRWENIDMISFGRLMGTEPIYYWRLMALIGAYSFHPMPCSSVSGFTCRTVRLFFYEL